MANVAAQARLGFLYAQGRGIAKDDAQAASWLEKAAAQGDTRRPKQSRIVLCRRTRRRERFRESGRILSQGGPTKAIWRRRSNLANLLAKGAPGVTQDYAEAAALFRKAAGARQCRRRKQPRAFLSGRPRGAEDLAQAADWVP
ncbi:MAG: hypothetical protein WDN29_03970 [Methylovirgula sp.]